MPKYLIQTDGGKYLVETADTSGGDALTGGMPIPDARAQMRADAMAKVSPELRGYTPDELAQVTDTSNPLTPIQHLTRAQQINNPYSQGAVSIGAGVAQIAGAGQADTFEHGVRQVAGGAHKIVSGGLQIAAPPALAAGILAAPVPTVLGLAGGTLAQKAATEGLEAVGVPEEYSDLAGDVAGYFGGSRAAEYGPELIASGINALPGARDTAADALRASAEKNIATALNPTTRVNKALVQNKLAPGIIDRGITATSLANLQEQAQAGMEKYGQIIDDIFDQHAEAGTKISPKPILAALDAEKQNYIVDGEPINPAYVNKLEDMQNQLQRVSDANGGAIPLDSLRRIRQINDEVVAKSKGAFALPPDDQSVVAAHATYGNAIRSAFAENVPELADANREFSFYSDLNKVAGDSLLRKTGQRAPLTQKILEGTGTMVGAKAGGPVGALIGKEVGGTLGKLQNSTLWNTLSAQVKTRIADLLASGDEAGAVTLAKRNGVFPNDQPGVAPAANAGAQSKGVSINGNAGTTAQGAPLSGALRGSGQVGAGTPAGQSGGIGSSDTVVTIPGQAGSGYQAKYAVKELDAVNASHNGLTFAPNAEYRLTNDRNYGNAVNQGKVIGWSSPVEFDPAYHLTDNPDATNGPIVTDAEGNVLGGNGRAMILQRVYNGNPQGAAAYRSLLEQKAAHFGINPDTFRDMKQPVLTREIPDAEFLKPGGSKQNAITDFNKKGTAELTPAERAIADSRRVSPDTLEHVAGLLDQKGADATLADVLQGKSGGDVLGRLVKDGVVSPQEQAAFMTSDGELTPAGKDRVSKLMLGRFFSDPAQLEAIAPSIRNKIERLAAPLAQVEGRGEWNLTPDVQSALEILQRAQSHSVKNVSDFIQQDGLFGAQKYSERAQALANAIQKLNPNELTRAARQYAGDSNFEAGGANLFGANPTPESSFADSFEKALADKPKNALAGQASKPANALAQVNGQAKNNAFASVADDAMETGPHGPIYREYSGKPAEAIDKLISERRGEVPAVWKHPQLGPIDLVWGDKNGGMQHILEKHILGRRDLKLEDLAQMIPDMEIDPARSDARSVTLISPSHRAAVRLDFDGKTKHWLVTAFERP